MSKLLGKWNVLTKTPMGDTKAVWIIKEEEGDYCGTLTSEGSTTSWESIHIEGKYFEMKISLQLPFGLTSFVMEGEYSEEDDTFTGISKMKMGKSTFKGKRAQ